MTWTHGDSVDGGWNVPKGHAMGRCHSCGRAFYWRRRVNLDLMECPACGSDLSQTTGALRRTFYFIGPIWMRGHVARVRVTVTMHLSTWVPSKSGTGQMNRHVELAHADGVRVSEIAKTKKALAASDWKVPEGSEPVTGNPYFRVARRRSQEGGE